MSHRVPPFILIAALAIGACGGGNDKPAASGSTSAPVATTPYGLYVRTVTKQDLARTAKLRDEHGPKQGAPPTGRYRLVIARGASQDVIKVTDPAGFTVDMDMSVTGGDLHLVKYVDPARATFCGQEAPEPAVYSYSSAAGSLQLRPKANDGCPDRDALLTGTWAKG